MRVQIVYPKDEWILNRLASYLIDNIDFVTGVPWEPDTSSEWDITYYINYWLYKPDKGPFGRKRGKGKTGAFFTHKRESRFDKAAKKVDFCVCPCRRTEEYLKKLNKNTFLIYHGIDLERFRPRIKLGFFGSTRDSERKGTEIFETIRGLPWVELTVTDGAVPEEKIPELYNHVDYVLISSTTEAGPLCFQEGLACGKGIISTDVGMVGEFKGRDGVYIFDKDRPQTLVSILEELYQERLKRRRLVEEYSISYFVGKHVELFESLAGARPVIPNRVQAQHALRTVTERDETH